MYSLIRPLLFTMQPEIAHKVALKALSFSPSCAFAKPSLAPKEVLGMTFPHTVGLAAGFDKNGCYIDALAKLGFAFIEVGTVTPRAQSGNLKPRLFRLPKSQALINRMGFNNDGVDSLIENIKRARYKGILGINIGKNKDTPLESALEDYRVCLQKVYAYASYVTINISSPNTADLRRLQEQPYLRGLLESLREEQLYLSELTQKYVPLVVKISPDESDEALSQMASTVAETGIDGVIATNTTQSRVGVQDRRYICESGGLSGKPLTERSTDCIRLIKSIVGDKVAIIASGGIDSQEVAQKKLAAGADLIQLYTGLIYKGPSLVHKCAEQ